MGTLVGLKEQFSDARLAIGVFDASRGSQVHVEHQLLCFIT